MSKKHKKQNEVFPHKTLLIFSGVCLGISVIFLVIMGSVLNILHTMDFYACGFLIIIVPLATHINLWAKFCIWKNFRVLPVILRVVEILSEIGVITNFVVYLVQKYA